MLGHDAEVGSFDVDELRSIGDEQKFDKCLRKVKFS